MFLRGRKENGKTAMKAEAIAIMTEAFLRAAAV